MKATPVSELPGLLVISGLTHRDERGFFQEIYHRDKLEAAGLSARFVQDNHSRSHLRVLRGMHFQHPKQQGKLVAVLRGEVFDVAVDVRVGSPFFGRWFGIRLSEANGLRLYVPGDFAHGFLTLSPEADVVYKCTDVYAPQSEHTLLWSDPDVGVEWPGIPALVSAKDMAGRTLKELQRRGKLPSYRL